MSRVALEKAGDFPKTVSAFIALCHTPVGRWYPEADALRDFSPYSALLDGDQLTEQASDYLFNLPDSVVQQGRRAGFIPQTVLDNWQMVQFIDEMKQMADEREAQRIYAAIRSYVVEHSWIDRNIVHELVRQEIPQPLIDRVKQDFYEQAVDNPFYVCERCGIVRNQDGRWQGIKPRFCDDHHDLQAAHIEAISRTHYLRLRAGIHLRTFIPGQAERTLFTEAETLHDEYPEHLVATTRYPGLDAYDLRLEFRDEVWAVDVKDIADPDDLSRKIAPLRGFGNLAHAKAFYVVPDRRLVAMPDYLELVRHHSVVAIEPPLFLLSAGVFSDRMHAKCQALAKASR